MVDLQSWFSLQKKKENENHWKKCSIGLLTKWVAPYTSFTCELNNRSMTIQCHRPFCYSYYIFVYWMCGGACANTPLLHFAELFFKNSKSYTIELWTKKISNNSLQLLSKLGTHKNKVVNTKGIWFGKFEACGDASKVLMIFNAFENAFGVIWSNLMKY